MANTIADLATEMERALDEMRVTRSLPEGWEGLRYLVPPDSHPRVTLRYAQGHRKIREDASAEYFEPASCEVLVTFEPLDDEENEIGSPSVGFKARSQPASEMIDDLVKALDQAESQREFVGLKWFRDQYLTRVGYAWAGDPRVCGRILRQATDSSLVLKSQVPNPKNPLHPVSAIRLNRSHPAIRKAERPESRRRFKPVQIRGEALSRTVLDGRR